MSELKQRAFDLYKPPFKFLHGYIFDSSGERVSDDGDIDVKKEMIAARIRGWGRIGYLPTPEQLQDQVGEMIAEALTEYWNRRAPEAGQTLSLDERMREAGMISVADMLAGTPIDKFVAHTGVKDLASFEEWLINCRTSHYRMQAKFELNNMQGDDMYEWYVAHNAVFHEVLVNFRAAKPQTQAEPANEEIATQWCKELVAALKRLSFAAQTTGGTAGRDEELCAAINQAEEALSIRATNRALLMAEQAQAEPAEGQEPVAQLAYGEQGRDPRDGPRLISYNDMPPGTYQLYTQPQRPAVPDGYQLVQTEVIRYLLGDGPLLTGEWFERPEGAAPFWWRKILRNALLTAAPAPERPAVVEVCPECDIADCIHIRQRRGQQ